MLKRIRDYLVARNIIEPPRNVVAVPWREHLDRTGKEEFEFTAEYENFEGKFTCPATGIRDKK